MRFLITRYLIRYSVFAILLLVGVLVGSSILHFWLGIEFGNDFVTAFVKASPKAIIDFILLQIPSDLIQVKTLFTFGALFVAFLVLFSVVSLISGAVYRKAFKRKDLLEEQTGLPVIVAIPPMNAPLGFGKKIFSYVSFAVAIAGIVSLLMLYTGGSTWAL